MICKMCKKELTKSSFPIINGVQKKWCLTCYQNNVGKTPEEVIATRKAANKRHNETQRLRLIEKIKTEYLKSIQAFEVVEHSLAQENNLMTLDNLLDSSNEVLEEQQQQETPIIQTELSEEQVMKMKQSLDKLQAIEDAWKDL